jgi:RHS repeat-associated protein
MDAHNNEGVFNEICYTGGGYDATTGLYYLNARFYDPVDVRFLSEDTVRGEYDNPGSLNLYAYCENDPINYTDPSGNVAIAIPAIAGAGIPSTVVVHAVGITAVIIAIGVCYNSYLKYCKRNNIRPRVEFHHPYHSRRTGYKTMAKTWRGLKKSTNNKIKWFMKHHDHRPHLHITVKGVRRTL